MIKSTYSNGDVLGRGKKPVNQDSHEGRVQAVLHGQCRKLGISHGLWNDDSTDSGTYGVVSERCVESRAGKNMLTCNEVSEKPCPVVFANPGNEGEEIVDV